MLEISYGLTFFLKSPKRKSDLFRYVYVRVTVDGVPKETSTKRKWDMRRWDQYLGRAIGTKEDTKSLNFFLGSLEVKISNFKTELVNTARTITSTRIIEFVKGHETSKTKVLEEFQKYNEEVKALVSDGYAKGTYTRYVTAKKTSGDDLYCTIF
ncbi:hypothetical protein [Chitinophaga polysaccharea]|uniref:hypothetical protein n=1 Tax=Chitinophaga polysaccharea TaxID=1293035 RepID=UPI00115A04AF|nr:hypothetical protein [Chitinophaga polysaccharea]